MGQTLDQKIYVSASASVALTAAYPATGAVLEAQAAFANSQDLAPMAWLSLITLQLTTIAGATTITWFLARDVDGNVPITPAQTDTILDPDADGDGSVVRTLGVEWNAEVLGDLYVFAETDAGTANAVAVLTWRLRAPAVA
jgi:hypothetical protein